MATEVNLPALGESVTEGTVTRWLKQVGDQVAVDEPLLEVSTDKVDTEIPSPVAGTLLEIKANEDDTVEVGAVLGIIGEEGEGGGSDSSAPIRLSRPSRNRAARPQTNRRGRAGAEPSPSPRRSRSRSQSPRRQRASPIRLRSLSRRRPARAQTNRRRAAASRPRSSCPSWASR